MCQLDSDDDQKTRIMIESSVSKLEIFPRLDCLKKIKELRFFSVLPNI